MPRSKPPIQTDLVCFTDASLDEIWGRTDFKREKGFSLSDLMKMLSENIQETDRRLQDIAKLCKGKK